MIDDTRVQCPYCGEMIGVECGPEGGTVQEFISDCEVCCRPIVFHVAIKGEDVNILAQTDDE